MFSTCLEFNADMKFSCAYMRPQNVEILLAFKQPREQNMHALASCLGGLWCRLQRAERKLGK